MVALRSGNSSVSCSSGVFTSGQSSSHSMAIMEMVSSAKRTASVAPGRAMRRSTMRPTSISGEMMTSMGMWSDANRLLYCGSR